MAKRVASCRGGFGIQKTASEQGFTRNTLSDSGGGEEQPPLKNVTVVVLILEICHVCHGVTVTRRPPAQLCQKQKSALELSYTFFEQ